MGTTASHHSGSRYFENLNCEITWSHSALQGKRESMEDDFSLDYEFGEYKSFFVSIFDGHHGKRAAQFASKHLHQTITNSADYRNCNFPSALIYAYEELDRKLLDISRSQDWYDGTTSITAFMTQEDPRLYVANAGDCRAIVVLNSGKCYPLSRDHNPSLSTERKRVLREGGSVKDGRIESQLSVSRGFGDRQFKEPKKLVIPTPDVISVPVDDNLKFMIIACDGLWGWVSNLQAARFVNLHLKEGMKPVEISKELTKYALEKGSSDNITVVVIVFDFKGEKSPSRNNDLWDIKVIDEKQKMMPYVKFHNDEQKKERTPKRRASLDVIVDEDASTPTLPDDDVITRRAHSIDLGNTKVEKKEKKRPFISHFKKKSLGISKSKNSKENGKKSETDSKKSDEKKKSKNK